MRDLSPASLDDLRHSETGWVKKAPKRGPYLEYVNGLSKKWPHLQFLSDFMEVGTHPLRWDATLTSDGGTYSTDPETKAKEILKRYEKVEVALLQYGEGTNPTRKETRCRDTKSLAAALNGLTTNKSSKLNLIVVEDLSRDVIELLGSQFDVDPSFFRQHLTDYAWYNIGSSWWRDPPNLDVSSSGQSWFSIRFLRTRHFADKQSFETGRAQSREFNIFRRLDNDGNENPNWHGDAGQKVTIGHVRSRASLWVDPSANLDGPCTAIVLLDPTIREGNPLWYTYRNWETPPSMKTWSASMRSSKGPNQATLLEDFIYWAQNPDGLTMKHIGVNSISTSPLDTPVCAMLHLICAEWLTVTDYTHTRLNQIDWELTLSMEAEDIRTKLMHANKRMHHWRRAIPLYRKMLSDTLVTVFREAPYVPGLSTARLPSALEKVLNTDAVNAYRSDVLLRLASMHDLQARFDKLSEVAAAAASTEESRSSNLVNQRLSNLTWIATTFLPLSLIAGLLSVQEDVKSLDHSISYWARIAIPLTAGTMLVLFLIELWPQWYKRKLKKGKGAAVNKQGGEEMVRRRSSLFSSTNSVRPEPKDRAPTDMSLRMHRLTGYRS